MKEGNAGPWRKWRGMAKPIEILTANCGVRIYDNGKIAYRPPRNRIWFNVSVAGRLGRPRKRASAKKLRAIASG